MMRIGATEFLLLGVVLFAILAGFLDRVLVRLALRHVKPRIKKKAMNGVISIALGEILVLSGGVCIIFGLMFTIVVLREKESGNWYEMETTIRLIGKAALSYSDKKVWEVGTQATALNILGTIAYVLGIILKTNGKSYVKPEKLDT